MNKKSELYLLLKRIDGRIEAPAKSRDRTKPLLELGLATSWNGGFIVTEKGKAFMFQWECEKFLHSLQIGDQPTCSEHVANWILKHQFAVQGGVREGWKITPRGRDWLSQLK